MCRRVIEIGLLQSGSGDTASEALLVFKTAVFMVEALATVAPQA
jgi:hypothetical protein